MYGRPVTWQSIDMFFSRNSTGHMSIFSASASIICSSAQLPCGKPGARNGRSGPPLT